MRADSASTNFKLAVCLAGFTGSSVGKESICNAGDPGLIPGLGRSPGAYPAQTLPENCRGR